MSEMLEKFGMGWLPDYPDFRDYTINHDKVSPRLLKLGQKAMAAAVVSGKPDIVVIAGGGVPPVDSYRGDDPAELRSQ